MHGELFLLARGRNRDQIVWKIMAKRVSIFSSASRRHAALEHSIVDSFFFKTLNFEMWFWLVKVLAILSFGFGILH